MRAGGNAICRLRREMILPLLSLIPTVQVLMRAPNVPSAFLVAQPQGASVHLPACTAPASLWPAGTSSIRHCCLAGRRSLSQLSQPYLSPTGEAPTEASSGYSFLLAGSPVSIMYPHTLLLLCILIPCCCYAMVYLHAPLLLPQDHVPSCGAPCCP